MTVKVSMAIAGLVAAVVFGAANAAGVSAAQATPPTETRAALALSEVSLPPELARSVIFCAAQTLDLSVERVRFALRNGHTLKEIGIRVGVRPAALENGILRCERRLLARLVEAGELEPSEARRIFYFLQENITRIINMTWND